MKTISLILSAFLVVLWIDLYPQDQPVYPKKVASGTYLGLSPPLRELPVVTAAELKEYEELNKVKPFNKWPDPSYPFQETALPNGPDPVWQSKMGEMDGGKGLEINFAGQASGVNPIDPNGCIGPDHYMQTINFVYAIYDRTGTLVAGPTALNQLFSGVPGSNCNSGDPIILYDEQAQRWLVAEFSLCNANQYMLIAVSQTNDPTGSWHKYSFDVHDTPDYMKFGVWRDAYYMGTNTHNADSCDIYAFERSQMLIGGSADMVMFDNPWRPGTLQGVQCALPADNDGTFAAAGEPGIFMILNNDAVSGGSDQIWIFPLAVNWTTPGSSTFNRVQQLNVPAFDANFGANWDNIKQQGTAQELCSISDLIMNIPQYMNWGTYETIVLCHTVDVDNTDHAGIRWYELRRTTGNWSIRQSGTYAPDAHSRWMGSIHMNMHQEIAMGYSISSSTMYPGIRCTGQDAIEYAKAAGVMNVAEMTIQTGAQSKTWGNRWGDYSSIFVDPVDNRTFWYTQMYIGSGTHQSRIAAFNVFPTSIYVDLNAAAGGNGTIGSPIKTVTLANQAAGPGTSVYVRVGTYDESNPILLHEDGMWRNYDGNAIIK